MWSRWMAKVGFSFGWMEGHLGRCAGSAWISHHVFVSLGRCACPNLSFELLPVSSNKRMRVTLMATHKLW